MFGDLEIWRMVRTAEFDARGYDRALRARLLLAAERPPNPLQRLFARLRPAGRPTDQLAGRLAQRHDSAAKPAPA
ncbi:MAG: hypothetical protein ACYDCQ_17445, partial [Dehalococcoidia bacterium]